jgi:hypothetical protein
MHPLARHGRVEQLRRALALACARPTAAHMAAVADAFQAVEYSTDEDDDEDALARRNDAIEMYAVESLGRKLVERLGPLAPAWLHRWGAPLCGVPFPTKSCSRPS